MSEDQEAVKRRNRIVERANTQVSGRTEDKTVNQNGSVSSSQGPALESEPVKQKKETDDESEDQAPRRQTADSNRQTKAAKKRQSAEDDSKQAVSQQKEEIESIEKKASEPTTLVRNLSKFLEGITNYNPWIPFQQYLREEGSWSSVGVHLVTRYVIDREQNTITKHTCPLVTENFRSTRELHGFIEALKRERKIGEYHWKINDNTIYHITRYVEVGTTYRNVVEKEEKKIRGL